MNSVVKIKLILFLLASISVSGCKKDSLCNCLESTGGSESEYRIVDAFTNIEMDNKVDVILTPGDGKTIKVTCGKNLLDGIETKVENNTLYIKNKNKCNWLRDFKNKFTVEIFYRNIDNITDRGSGDITCSDTLKTNFLQVESWNGTGNLNFVLNTDEVYFKLHTGPADISASGITSYLYVYSAGNGYVRASGLIAKTCHAYSKSTGDCEVYAGDNLSANIQYHGDIYYRGNPAYVESQISGSGRLIPF